MRIRSLVALALACASAACQPSPRTLLENHTEPATPGAPVIIGLERLEAHSLYVPGAVERFRVLYRSDEEVTFSWQASAGELKADGDTAAWQLPDAERATLTATVRTASGRETSQSFELGLVPPVGTAAATPVDSSQDATGSVCDLAFDGAGTPRIVYRNDTHPGLWYATWNGTAWVTELVDGMGFNQGGEVRPTVSLALDGAGNPHIAYAIEGKGVWYATKSGSTWTRESVDMAGMEHVAIALNPAQGGRPTVLYTNYTSIASCTANYWRPFLAARTGTATWIPAPMTTAISGSACYNHRALGGLGFDSVGTAYFPTVMVYGSYISAGMVAWNGSTTQVRAFGSVYGTNMEFLPLTFDGAGQPLAVSTDGIFQFSLPIGSSSVFSRSPFESSSVNYVLYDVAFSAGKPYIAVRHGSELELVVPDARGYWTYTHLGNADSSTQIGVAVDRSGVGHACYRLSGKITYQ